MSEQYLALYRKYRPKSFEAVSGQTEIVNLLTSAIKSNKVTHAYLFCGSRGTGKTTVARIFAEKIGCNDEDIIELDAASNRGIDEVRELREAVRTAPFSSPYKVYIIDEAHMLTKEAANALLKTLEEPPSHVIFILATTDPEKLPNTIVSRCQKINFQQPDVNTLSERILFISKNEGFLMDDNAAKLVALHGKGSYRDAIGILEQILTVSDKKISEDNVKMHVGSPDKQLLLNLLKNLCTKNSKELINCINELSSKKSFTINTYDMFTELLRTALLMRIGNLDSNIDEDLFELAKTYPKVISSKSILTLLERRNLISVSEAHSYIAFESILLSMMDEE